MATTPKTSTSSTAPAPEQLTDASAAPAPAPEAKPPMAALSGGVRVREMGPTISHRVR